DLGSSEYARVAFDLLYDNGSVTVYTAAGSPYTVSANTTVGNNAVLIIQPGATVYVNAGVTLQATGSGKIMAEGTPAQHIHITKNPAQANWGSLDFINATVESRLAYVDFDSCGGTTTSDGH